MTVSTTADSPRGAGNIATSHADSDQDVIDVVSHGASAPEQPPAGRSGRSLTLDGTDEHGRYDAGDVDARDEDSDDDKSIAEDEDEEEAREHAYRRGRQAIPMESPGDELNGDLLIDDDDDDVVLASRAAGGSVQRLPRLRGRRGFFQADMDDSGSARSFRYRSSGGILQRITLRRRKRGEHDVFWTAILVLTLLSFVLMSIVVVYLTQTDFFASHQNDLFGTTVDNRFTVVSQQDAQIFLKSGYSNSVYSEGMIAFDEGELRLGRRALASAETQSFFGLSLFANGTASFTNKIDTPMIEAEYLHAGKAVVFDDGTVMTTAANMSGGVKEVGDLNLVSQSGSVVTSAGGKPLLVVDPEGTVTVSNPDAEDPTLMGITLDGAHGRVSIAQGLELHHDENSSRVSTSHALHLNTSEILLGDSSTAKVRFTVADLSGDDEEDEDEAEVDGGGRAMAAIDGEEESESVTLEIAGQTSSAQKEGGDVRVVGGDGMEVGGDVVLLGGKATDIESDSDQYGSIAINAGLDETASSLTEIGSHSPSHAVNIHGLVAFNYKAAGVNKDTLVKIAGGRLNVSSEHITLDNRATSDSQLRLNSNSMMIGASSPAIQIGQQEVSEVTLEGGNVSLDATAALEIGSSASEIWLGGTETPGQLTKLVSPTIELEARHGVSINKNHAGALTSISGVVQFNGSSNTVSLLSITDAAVRVNPPKFRVGPRGNTRIASIEAMHVSIGAPGANATVAAPANSRLEILSGSIEIGSEESTVTMSGNNVLVDAVDTLTVGEDAETVAIGKKSVESVNIQAKAVAVAGETSISGDSLMIQSTDIVIGDNSTSTVTIGASTMETASLEAQSIWVGSRAESVSIGVGSPTVEIGSTEGVINLSGAVTLNGEPLEARRRLDTQGHFMTVNTKAHFGFLDADRVVVALTEPSPSPPTEFPLTWEAGFSSEPEMYRLETRRERFLSIEPAGEDGQEDARSHLQIALRFSSAWLEVTDEKMTDSRPSKLRCRVYRHTPDQDSSSGTVVLEVSTQVEHCAGSGCDDGIFLGLDGQRIVSYSLRDSFSTQCALASAAVGELVIKDAQYSFTEL